MIQTPLQKKINEYLELGVPHRTLAKGTGLDWATLQKIIETGDFSAKRKILKLCKYFKLMPEEVLNWNEDDQDYMEAVKVSDRIEAGEEPTFTLAEAAEKLGEREASK